VTQGSDARSPTGDNGSADDRTPELTLVVLAAGVGSRYGGLKQLESVGPAGESLLEYSAYDAMRAGIRRAVLVIRRDCEQRFRRSLGHGLARALHVSYVVQRLSDVPAGCAVPKGRTRPWGTGHALLSARDAVRGPFVVINADDFYGRDAFATLSEFLRTRAHGAGLDFALAAFEVGATLSESGPVSRGLCRVDAAGWLEAIFEVPKLAKLGDGARYTDATGAEQRVAADELVSMNMWGFSPEIFSELTGQLRRFLASTPDADHASELLIPDVVQRMVAGQRVRVRVLCHRGRWCGITFPDDLARARAFIARLVADGEYPERLWP
jgi:dTDP-glucose pyrophosphorylase